MSDQFDQLTSIIKKLRDPNGGCPWDIKQTHETLKPYVIEEAYEVVDAIDRGPTELKKELGDILLQVMLHSQIAEDNGDFVIGDVVAALTTKLIARHPHVFGNTQVKDAEEVLNNWEKIKAKDLTSEQSILDGVPNAMPALLRAQRVSVKAARVGFEWSSLSEIKDKVLEEVQEFAEACIDPKKSRADMEDEFGDIYFALVQLARRMDFDAEQLLQKSTNKFIKRFKRMEILLGKPVDSATLPELNSLWNQVKEEFKTEVASAAKE